MMMTMKSSTGSAAIAITAALFAWCVLAATDVDGGGVGAHSCDIAGAWVKRDSRMPSRTGTWVAADIANVPNVDFNVNWDIRHGPRGGNG